MTVAASMGMARSRQREREVGGEVCPCLAMASMGCERRRWDQIAVPGQQVMVNGGKVMGWTIGDAALWCAV